MTQELRDGLTLVSKFRTLLKAEISLDVGNVVDIIALLTCYLADYFMKMTYPMETSLIDEWSKAVRLGDGSTAVRYVMMLRRLTRETLFRRLDEEDNSTVPSKEVSIALEGKGTVCVTGDQSQNILDERTIESDDELWAEKTFYEMCWKGEIVRSNLGYLTMSALLAGVMRQVGCYWVGDDYSKKRIAEGIRKTGLLQRERYETTVKLMLLQSKTGQAE